MNLIDKPLDAYEFHFEGFLKTTEVYYTHSLTDAVINFCTDYPNFRGKVKIKKLEFLQPISNPNNE